MTRDRPAADESASESDDASTGRAAPTDRRPTDHVANEKHLIDVGQGARKGTEF